MTTTDTSINTANSDINLPRPDNIDGDLPNFAYGCIPDTPNPNDKFVRFSSIHVKNYMDLLGLKYTTANMPSSFNVLSTLKNGLPGIQKPYNQGSLGSCSAHGSAFVYVFEQLKQNNVNPIMPSRLDIYYKSRAAMNKILEDSGASISGAIASLLQNSICIEKEWVYDVSKYQQVPPVSQYGTIFKGLTSERIDLSDDVTQDAVVHQLKSALLSGHPFIFGFMVSASFESEQTKRTGIMPMPQPGEANRGGHCGVGIGYDDSKQAFLIRNSWGLNWGQEGNYYMPYAFIADKTKTFDFWALTSVSSPVFQPIDGYNDSYFTPMDAKDAKPIPGPGPIGPVNPFDPPQPKPLPTPLPIPPKPQPQPLPPWPQPQPQPLPPWPQPLPPWPQPQPLPPWPQPQPQPHPLPQPFPPFNPWDQWSPWNPWPPQPLPKPRPFPRPWPRTIENKDVTEDVNDNVDKTNELNDKNKTNNVTNIVNNNYYFNTFEK